jgi:hypothetical protein
LIKKNKTHKNLLVNKTTDPIFEWSLIGTLSKLCPTVLSSIKIKVSSLTLHNWYKSAERKRKISQEIPENMLNKNALSCSYYFKYITVLK